jgi:hypothetical protein
MIGGKIMEAKVESWKNIKERYPDSFVLIENPVFKEKYSPELLTGVFRYKNRQKKKVLEKMATLNIGNITVQYTGGIREEKLKDTVFIL